MNTRYFYHPDKNLVATLDHVEGDLYRVEVWRVLLHDRNMVRRAVLAHLVVGETFEKDGDKLMQVAGVPRQVARMHVVNETTSKQVAFEQLQEFLEYDPDLIAHQSGDLELELGHSGGG